MAPIRRWYRVSDDKVHQCSKKDVLAVTPYMLFYDRIASR